MTKPPTPPHADPSPKTPLQAFMDANDLTSSELEKEIAICRQTMTRIRGGSDLRLSTMNRILIGIRRMTKRRVRMDEIFHLDPDDPTA